jgi:hypothetical protein
MKISKKFEKRNEADLLETNNEYCIAEQLQKTFVKKGFFKIEQITKRFEAKKKSGGPLCGFTPAPLP